jgi:DNA-binding IclR family transcriptional regulator
MCALQTVQKIGPVLDPFTVERPEWGASEVAAVIDIPRSKAHTLLPSLVDTGLLSVAARSRIPGITFPTLRACRRGQRARSFRHVPSRPSYTRPTVCLREG